METQAEKDEWLICASKLNDLQLAKHYLEVGADVNANNCQPMAHACSQGYIDFLHLLIANGCDINPREGQILLKAAAAGLTEIVQILGEAGADLTVDNSRALPAAMDAALKYGYQLVDFGVSHEPIHTELVDYLLAQGLDPKIYPFASLLYAAAVGNCNLVKTMLDSGLINDQRQIQAAADHAEIFHHPEIVELLDGFNKTP